MKIRLAQKKDREKIIEITSHTWEGWDYVYKLLDEWFIEGGLFVAEEDEEIVGVTKTTILSPGELWLEGIRVKETLRRKGIGKELAFFQLEDALKQKPRVIRLSTAEVNIESINLIEMLGFEKIKEFAYMEMRNPKEKRSLTEVIKGKDHEAIWDYIRNSTFFNESKGLQPWSWIFRETTPELISSFIKEERIFITKKNGRIVSLAILLPHRYEKETVELCFIEGDSKVEIGDLFDLAQSYAVSNNLKDITFYAPFSKLESLAQKAGFSFPYEFKKVFVYELVSG
ncbi:MAG: GNAT family N-acetyltransferase [Candidatus Cloacimonadota bacterium]|nr:MAG: GNAT family N-acetyltransferase [Candidatus Cloacimonadota bacterium]